VTRATLSGKDDSIMGHADELDDRLRAMESAAAAFDGGEAGASGRAAEALMAVFQESPPLLSRLGGTYVKLASAVPKSPYPPGKFAPMTEVLIDLAGPVGATTALATGYPPPGFRARLGPAKAFRATAAPDWWKSEPVFLCDHSKVTRRDAVQAAAGASDAAAEHLREVLHKAGWCGCSVSGVGQFTWVVPVREAAAAVVRQVVHEVLHSPELLKLAGRAVKA
jgi:hypothetical protein